MRKLYTFLFTREEEIRYKTADNFWLHIIMHNLTELYLICDKPLVTAREGKVVACFLILCIMIGIHESLMPVVDGNEHRGDQFRGHSRSGPNKRRIRKSLRNLSFLSRRGRTRGSIDRRYSDVLFRRQRRKDMRNFVRGSCWPEHVAVSGLNRRVCRALLKCPVLRLPSLRPRRYEQDEREVSRP